jgi:hypothetical protein
MKNLANPLGGKRRRMEDNFKMVLRMKLAQDLAR